MESVKNGSALVQVSTPHIVVVETITCHTQDYSVSETTLEQIFLSFARGENKGQENNGQENVTMTPL